MAVTQELLAERLKTERIKSGLTQEEVADILGFKRPTVTQIEAGNRAVTGLELAKFAGLYGLPIEHFLRETDEVVMRPLTHFRSAADLDEMVWSQVDTCIKVCRAATDLENLLELSKVGLDFSYTIDRPTNRWEAVEQGTRLAAMERRRLELGSKPVRNIVEVISRHGVRVGRYTLSDDISGLFFVGSDTGRAILVNAGHSITRRLFSYAHEYCHLLADSKNQEGVSRFGNRDELMEVRANAFAANFLLPMEGVRSFLDGLGSPSRQVLEVFDGFYEQNGNESDELLTAQRRSSQEIRMIDVLRLARHFGASYSASVYQLSNLKIIQKDAQESLLSEQDRAEAFNRILGIRTLYLEQEEQTDLKQTVSSLTVDAWLQGLITRERANEYFGLLGLHPPDLDILEVGA